VALCADKDGGVMTVLAGSGVQVSAKRRGYRLTALVLLVMMLGGTLPVPLYVLYEKQMGFGPLGVTVVFAAYVVGTLSALVALGDLSDHIGRHPQDVHRWAST
jgi:MFS family permease